MWIPLFIILLWYYAIWHVIGWIASNLFSVELVWWVQLVLTMIVAGIGRRNRYNKE